ncbi:DUF3443 family protein [Streptomyces sp. NPDC086023]|uniref:DUF3443 family protein n=1 Tax=Streptomyces sp. NPDC086023 TaxID=3365746 RepID=UPI0037D09C24
MWSAVVAVAIALALPGCDSRPAEIPGARTRDLDVPLRYLPAGSLGGRLAHPRLGATVTIGSSSLNVLVDTGSTGLKVLKKKIAGTDAVVASARAEATFLSGLRVSGQRARATVTLGRAEASDQPLLLVDTVGCTRAQPRCEAAGGQSPEAFGGAFDGILGIGASAPDRAGPGDCCTNPMAGLTGGGSYLVHFDPARPRLVLNPVHTAGFTTVSLAPARVSAAPHPERSPHGTPLWDPAPFQGCLRITGLLERQCAPVLFDTGTATLVLSLPSIEDVPAPPLTGGQYLDLSGTQVTLAIPRGRWRWTYPGPQNENGTADQDQLNALATPQILYENGPAPLIVAGLPAFAHTDVLYDLRLGRMGIEGSGLGQASPAVPE